MQISLHQLRQGQQKRVTGRVQLDLQRDVPDLLHLEPMEVTAHLEKQDTHLFSVHVEQKTCATLTCSRCLTPFSLPLEAEWTELFTDVEYMARETDEQEIYFVEESLDLQPLIREVCLLQIPFAPVCDEHCQGICPKCGVNKNIDTCSCDLTRIDPRMAKLQDFFKGQD